MQKDESATAMESQLGELLTGIEREGTQLGQFALTVILHDTDQRQLERATAEARKALAGLDATLYEERQNVLVRMAGRSARRQPQSVPQPVSEQPELCGHVAAVLDRPG